jgi:hypothetical protein
MPTDVRNSGSDGRESDDWLSGSGEFDWGDDPSGPGRPLGTRTARSTSTYEEPWDPSSPGPRPDEATIMRRRILWGAAALGAILVIVIAVVALAGGDGDNDVATQIPTTTVAQPPPPPPSQNTTPAKTTTTPATGTGTITIGEGEKLETGSTGAEVEAVQQALTTLGLDPGPVDGKYGASTAEAVKQFQQAHGLDADGVVGPATAQAINQALAAA